MPLKPMEGGVMVQMINTAKRESDEGQGVTLNLVEMSLGSFAILASFYPCDKYQREAIHGKKCAG